MTSKVCNICEEIAGRSPVDCGRDYEEIVSSQQNVIAKTKNFILLPSVGPLNNSHVMLVPKLHVNSFAELSCEVREEAMHSLAELRLYAADHFGSSLIFFESGAGRYCDHSGGCIVHAHIHGVIKSKEFHQSLVNEIGLEREDGRCFTNADIDYGYVWYMDAESNSFICNHPLLPSQFLRYLYAQCGGNAQMWNWRRHINIGGVREVISNYSSLSNGIVDLRYRQFRDASLP